MVRLFKVDQVFYGVKSKVNDYFTFNTSNIDFDITQYQICLYFGTANYYLLNDSNDKEIYRLEFVGVNLNPRRVLIHEDSEIYDLVRNFYNKFLKILQVPDSEYEKIQ